ncbi:MAG: inosine/xanthosine triphosphatase [Candidatus Methanomethylophilaceae archaeon]
MKAAVAGTFNVLHDGHKTLIDRAFSISDDVYIGITSDLMAGENRNLLNPFYIRKKVLEEYLSKKNGKWKIFQIDDIYGPKEIMAPIDTLVVSEDTFENGKRVNEYRIGNGMRPLELSVVPMMKNDKNTSICSSDILSGRYGRKGNSDIIDIAVGSMNPVKIEAVRSVMERIYGDARITAVNVKSNVPEQPFEEETVNGAKNRARSALGNHDLSVGIEAGVFEMYDGLYDIQHCVIMDREGKMTVGMGPGFRYPDRVAKLIREGRTVGKAMGEIYTNDYRGRSEGAIGVLSKGLLDRKELTEQSVIAAMLPRIWDEV